MVHPRYRIPPALLPGLAGSLFRNRPRSFRQDARACLAGLDPSLRVSGAENLPETGPLLVTFNHYTRPGFHAWWLALALAAALPGEAHFVMTGELTFPGKWYGAVGRPVSRWLLHRLAAVYGFTCMPPMPPRPREVSERAASVRQALGAARAHPQGFLALSPEGSDRPGGGLGWPPEGAGRFLLLLAGAGFPVLPAAFFEAGGQLCLAFGRRYRLTLPGGLPPRERDRWAAARVMEPIARLLPGSLRGPFGQEG